MYDSGRAPFRSGMEGRPDRRGAGDAMKVLWVKVGGLWPLNTGGRLRSFHIVSELSRRHRVTLLTTHGPGEDPEGLSAHLPRCESVISFPYTIPKRNSPRFALALLRSWLSPLPVDLSKFRVAALSKKVCQTLEAKEVDLCVADFLSATPNVCLGSSVPIVFFAHNVEHVIWKRLGQIEKRIWRRLALELEWRKMRWCEAKACTRAELAIAVSDLDRELLALIAPGASLCTIPTGVDISYFSANGIQESAAHLVFTGSMDWQPNEDAVLYFMDAILPRIRSEVPAVSFSVVGRNPTPRLLAATQQAGVTVTGTVDDIRPYVVQAAVYVVPLRIGGGTRLKLFEALAMGKAVVSTQIGAEGLPLTPGEHFLRADDPADFAQAVVSLIRHPERRKALGSAGRKLVEERYSWPQVARQFEAKCEEAVKRFAEGKIGNLCSTRLPMPGGRSWGTVLEKCGSIPNAKAIIRKLIPGGFINHLRACRKLDPRARSIYWKLQLLRVLKVQRAVLCRNPAAIRSVLIVCMGNMIRSPMAAALLRKCLLDLGQNGVAVSSAGLRAKWGRSADARALTVAGWFGISLEEHRARPLTREMVAQADAIFVMDSLNEAEMLGRFPEAASKVFLLSVCAGNGLQQIEIIDPYNGGEADIRRCYEILQSSIRGLVSNLFPQGAGEERNAFSEVQCAQKHASALR